jgi:hypothetical protein
MTYLAPPLAADATRAPGLPLALSPKVTCGLLAASSVRCAVRMPSRMAPTAAPKAPPANPPEVGSRTLIWSLAA